MAKHSKAKANTVSLSTEREKSKVIPSVSALNPSQKNVLRAIAAPENHIVFVNGIAGTGKTYLAASWGVGELLRGRYERMIITRPYVEAGEKLGFLPGEFQNKIAPFMIPIMQTLEDHMRFEEVEALIKSNKIVVLPLAYMRGVTFKKAFVLLDEAQNTTPTQMHLFLTRIGEGSKVVVTGDPCQSDLQGRNGLSDALYKLPDVPGIEIANLDPSMVVRHPIIQSINDRYGHNREG